MTFLVYMLPLLTTLGISNAEDSLPRIEIHCGLLSVEGYESCKITHNSQVIDYTGPDKTLIPNPRFGLITYKCDGTVGYLVSELDCKACDFHCSQEDLPTECQEDFVRIWSGVIFGLCLSAVINVFIFRFLYNAPKTSSSLFNVKFINRNKRHELSDTLKSTAPLGKKTLLSVTATILLMKTVCACDYTLVVENSAVVLLCDDGKCVNVQQPPTLHVDVGQDICIEDGDAGEHISLTVFELTFKLRYKLSYYTSDYQTPGVTGVGACCHRTTVCSKCYEETLEQLKINHADSTDLIKGWDCLTTVVPNPDVGCISFMKKERVGELYPIYTVAEQVWAINFVLERNGYFNNMVVDSTFNATVLELNEVNKIPTTIVSVTDLERSGAILYGNKLFYVNASSANNPENDFLGDFQTSIDKQKEIYWTPTDIKCQPKLEDCSCHCNYTAADSESGMSQFIKKQNTYRRAEKFLIRENDNAIDNFKTLSRGSVQLRIGDWKIENYVSKEAKCDFQLLTSFACKSCNESSYIVLLAQNIENIGYVPFHSNCSFEKKYVKCDSAPTKLILKDTYQSCFIKMPSLKQKVSIALKYFDFDQQLKSITKENCPKLYTGYGEAFQHLVTSEQFIETVTKTTIFCSLLGLVLAFVLRKVGELRKKRHEEEGCIRKQLSEQLFQAHQGITLDEG